MSTHHSEIADEKNIATVVVEVTDAASCLKLVREIADAHKSDPRKIDDQFFKTKALLACDVVVKLEKEGVMVNPDYQPSFYYVQQHIMPYFRQMREGKG